jgi:hypothetical protein
MSLPDDVTPSYIIYAHITCGGARGSVVVKALCYKPEYRGFQTR